jgi:hypothetical protein
LPWVHPSIDTGPFVEALVLNVLPRMTMLETSTLMLFSDYAKLWGEINNVKIELQPMSIEEYADMWPGGLGIEVAQSAYFAREFGWDGGKGAVLPEKAGVKKGDLSDLTSYIKSTDWSSVLNQKTL